jgi:hypothetical protein
VSLNSAFSLSPLSESAFLDWPASDSLREVEDVEEGRVGEIGPIDSSPSSGAGALVRDSRAGTLLASLRVA